MLFARLGGDDALKITGPVFNLSLARLVAASGCACGRGPPAFPTAAYQNACCTGAISDRCRTTHRDWCLCADFNDYSRLYFQRGCTDQHHADGQLRLRSIRLPGRRSRSS